MYIVSCARSTIYRATGRTIIILIIAFRELYPTVGYTLNHINRN